MRGLADAMGIAPMTLYRHVSDKQALLALIPDALLADVAKDVCRRRTAVSALKVIARGLAGVLEDHAGSATLFAHPAIGPNMQAAGEHVTTLLVARGLTADHAQVVLRAVVAQVIGEVITMHGEVDLRGVDLLIEGVDARLAQGE